MLLVWRRLLRVYWTARRSNQSILKEISPEYSLEGLMLTFQYFGHLMQRANSWKSPLCWERLNIGGEGEDRGWDGWMASLTQWIWVWACCRSWWWTGKPGVLQSRGSQRVGHDWASELNWTVSEFGFLESEFGFLEIRRSWMDLKVSESWVMCITKGKSNSEKDTCCLMPSVWHSGEGKNYRYSKETRGFQGLRGEVGWRSMNRQKTYF